MTTLVGRRILVIDDHEPWRRQIASVARDGGWQVVGEGADGLEGVRLTEELKPDVILLDVELPTLNGLEAARRILARDASARILFLTAHRSWDIAAAALGTGGSGYILKSEAGHELLPARSTPPFTRDDRDRVRRRFQQGGSDCDEPTRARA
jgi:DNA-binding NarL/FixJ family response regulator